MSSKPKNASSLKEHQLKGKTLTPIFATLPLKKASWRNERLPEMMWVALLFSRLPRNEAFEVCHSVADYIWKLRDATPPFNITHSGLAALQPADIEALLLAAITTRAVRQALTPLLLLNDLPAKEQWIKVLGTTPTEDDWKALMYAVGQTLDHQSQVSTDCRWFRVIALMAAKKFNPPSEELAKEFLNYPEYGDQRAVRPTIRSTEGALSALDPASGEWAAQFWKQCLADTPCFPIDFDTSVPSSIIGTTAARIKEVQELLVVYSYNTITTTDVDARHDTVFGTALYCMTLLQEMLRIGVSQSVMARLALRTIGECFVSLSYLAFKDTPDLWQSYRVFGAGQAKLAYLKYEEAGRSPQFVNVESLKELANEDMWEEFLSIELGHWDKSNLRKLSEDAGVKDDYDQFYSWTSTFTHGHWGAVRDTVFDICGNPLHRLHRIPKQSANTLSDVLPDACAFTDKVLEVVSRCYPDFPHRVSV